MARELPADVDLKARTKVAFPDCSILVIAEREEAS